jgi:hypothetical protein
VVMTAAEVRRLQEDAKTNELPGHAPYSSVLQLVRRFQGRWPVLAKQCLQQVYVLVLDVVKERVQEVLGRDYPAAAEKIRWAAGC